MVLARPWLPGPGTSQGSLSLGQRHFKLNFKLKWVLLSALIICRGRLVRHLASPGSSVTVRSESGTQAGSIGVTGSSPRAGVPTVTASARSELGSGSSGIGRPI